MTEQSSLPSAARPTRYLLHALCVIGAYTLLFAWLYARPVLEQSYLAESDLYEFFLPTFLSRITTWSTFEFGGMPAFADPGDASFYPLHFLFARVIGSWTGLVVSALVIAASGTYAYVYSITGSRLAAAFSGLAYGLSEAMLERLAHFGIFHTIAWIPLILLCVDRLRGPRPLRWVAIGSLVTACCFLSGNPQTFLYGAYAAALYAVAGGVATRASFCYYVAAFGMAALGGVLSAVKVLPVLEASLYTARQTVGYGPFVSHSNTPAAMLSILFPTILHEGREAPTYVGLATLLFAILAARRALSQWRVAFWISIVVIALLLGMGHATPLAGLAFDLPFYDRFRVVCRHLYLAALGLAALAGIAIADVQQRSVSLRSVLAASAATALVLAAGAASLPWVPDRFDFESGASWAYGPWNGSIWIQFGIGAAAVIAALGLTWKARGRAWAAAALLLLLVADLLHSLPHPIDRRGIESPPSGGRRCCTQCSRRPPRGRAAVATPAAAGTGRHPGRCRRSGGLRATLADSHCRRIRADDTCALFPARNDAEQRICGADGPCRPQHRAGSHGREVRRHPHGGANSLGRHRTPRRAVDTEDHRLARRAT